MGLKNRATRSNKNPPIFSNEFIIQNHADIVSCFAMIFVLGLMFQVTSPFASMFIALHHNATSTEGPDKPEVVTYTYGIQDICVAFFYFLICIVIHAIIQEYVLDKINRKFHLSKVKNSKFNESGQLVVFYLISVLWGGDIIFREKLLQNISLLWEGYPHSGMNFMFKFFFIVQLAYWIHSLPELYFQKVKSDEAWSRVQYAVLYFTFLLVAYLLNFTRVTICLLVLHYLVESVFHISRLLYFADKVDAANRGFMVWNVLFVLARLSSVILSVLTFWYGLCLSDDQTFDFEKGNFNIPMVRINCLVAVCLLQAWMMWSFITFHLRRMREDSPAPSVAPKKKTADKKTKKGKKDDTKLEKTKRVSEEDVSELPEVDQNTKKVLRQRAVKK